MVELEKRFAVSAVIFNNEGKVLIARRGPNKHPFPNTFSLPSTYIRGSDGELVHTDVDDLEKRRQLELALKEKLGLEITIDPYFTESMEGKQADYLLNMTDYFTGLISDTQLILPNGTDFTEVIFVNPIERFGNKDRTKMGFCMQTMLRTLEQEPNYFKRFTFYLK